MLRIGLLPLTYTANEMEVISFRLFFADSGTLAVLPYVAFLTSNTVSAIVHLPIDAANTVEDPVLLFIVKFF